MLGSVRQSFGNETEPDWILRVVRSSHFSAKQKDSGKGLDMIAVRSLCC